MKKTINYEIAKDMLSQMPDTKKESLIKALTRNSILTSAYCLENGCMTIYKEGFYLTLLGCRCQFSVFAADHDGNLKFMRKPNETKLHKLYDYSMSFNESDFRTF